MAPTYDTLPLLQPSGDAGVTSDALFTNCTIALNPDTGKLVWHYQHVSNDQWDLDWVFERQLVEMTIGGRQRKVVMNVGKMAILDALDAATGEYLFSVDAKTQNVITSIDPKTGAKRIDLEKWPDPKRPALICPAISGARSWPPTSYSPQTTLLYLPLTEWCQNFGAEGFKLLTSGVGMMPAVHPDAADGTMGRLQAVDVAGRKLAWVHHQRAPFSASVLATAGGVLFAGDLDPSLKAFDAATGKLLWQAALDDLPSSSIITYSAARRSTSRSSWACATTTSTICRGRTTPSSRTEVRPSRRSGVAPRSGSSRSNLRRPEEPIRYQMTPTALDARMSASRVSSGSASVRAAATISASNGSRVKRSSSAR